MLALYSLCRRSIEPNSSPTGLSLFANSNELQYKVIKSQGINTVDSKCLTPVNVAHYAFMSCSTLRLIKGVNKDDQSLVVKS